MAGPGFVPTIFAAKPAGRVPAALLDACFSYVSAKQLNVKDFNAVGDGVADDTAAINAAFAYINTIPNTPVALTFPPGIYKTAAVANLTFITRSNVAILGYGAKLMVEGSGNGGIYFFNVSGQITNLQVVGLAISSSTTGGLGIAFQNCVHINLTDIYIENQALGMQFSSVNNAKMANFTLNLNTVGLKVLSGADFLLVNGVVRGSLLATPPAGTMGIQLVSCSGASFNQVDITQCDHGIDMTPGNGASVQWTFLNNVYHDTCNYGFYGVPTGTGFIYGIFSSSGWFANCNVEGIHLDGTASATAIVGASFDGATNIFINHGWGANIASVRDLHFENCYFADNNTSNVAGIGGLLVTDGTGLIVHACHFLNDTAGWQGFVYAQNTHLKLAGAPDDIHIEGNIFRGAATADLNLAYGSFPTRGAIRNNSTDRNNVVASATNITPDPVFDWIHISGTTLVANILTQGFPGRELAITTDGACTIQNSFNFKLAGGANFVGTAGSTLTLRWNRTTTSYGETGRSIL